MTNIEEGIQKVLELGYSELDSRAELEQLHKALSQLDVNQQIERMRFLGAYKPGDPVLSNFERFKQSLKDKKNEK